MVSHMFLVFIFFFSNILYGSPYLRDEIDFFNVGQGHAVLINKVGAQVPLLIDSGSTSHPYIIGKKYEWDKENSSNASISKISKRVLEFWQVCNGGHLVSGDFRLNIIITHPEKDHYGFIPTILTSLENRAQNSSFKFKVSLLLGGKAEEYNTLLLKEELIENKTYSSQIPGLRVAKSCSFLDSSGCITHLFCPQTDKGGNEWSIITRIKLERLSAIIAGDATKDVKEQMFIHFGQHIQQLESDILLVPHHGAENSFNLIWDQAVNPRAVIIGAAPHKSYCHPRGKTILELLNNGRLWSDIVQPHGIQYYGDNSVNQAIQARLQRAPGRIFDPVPNIAFQNTNLQPFEQWHLAWTNLPIYTLWTTGTLCFSHSVNSPVFVEAPHGLMNYVAVSNPEHLFPPHMRNRLSPLTEQQLKFFNQISDFIKENHKIQSEVIEEENKFSKELLLIEEQNDRDIYLMLLNETLTQKGIKFYSAPLFFTWMREAIIKRNRMIPFNKERLLEAARLIMLPKIYSYQEASESKLKYLGNDKQIWELLSQYDVSTKALILKTFIQSNHLLDNIGNYINALNNITWDGPDRSEIDALCPFGFPEWIQLAQLVKYFREVISTEWEEKLSIMDIEDITALRLQGKNFKEIAKILTTTVVSHQAQESKRIFEEMEKQSLSITTNELNSHLQKLNFHEIPGYTFYDNREELLKMLDTYHDKTFQNEKEQLLKMISTLKKENFLEKKAEITILLNRFQEVIFKSKKEEYERKLNDYFPDILNTYLS